MQLSPRRGRRRPQRRHGLASYSPTQLGGMVAAIFLIFWAGTVWYTSVALMDKSHVPHPVAAETAHSVAKDDYSDSHNNPYFGWQPPIAAEMACSWRKCFEKEHEDCTTCRDGADELGVAPPPTVDTDDWIPDVTMLSRMRQAGVDATGNPWPPPLDDELCQPMGPAGGRNDINKELLDAVPIVAHLPNDDKGDTNNQQQQQQRQRQQPKIMCLLYTMESAHANKIRAIRETWASQCDGFLAFSTASDPRIPAISIPHDGPESYNNMWQKVRQIWKFVGSHYIHDFDWFFQGGDDLFVLPQNLRNYLSTLDAEGDHFVGRRFKGYGEDNYFNSGGSGYALSRGILHKYIHEGGWAHPDCAPDRTTSMEDVMIAQCLRKVFGVGLTDTRDQQGRERFHPFAPGTHLNWQPPAPGKKDWYADYNREWPVQLGTACCAPDSVSFHYIKNPAMVRHMYALLYLCGKDKNP